MNEDKEDIFEQAANQFINSSLNDNKMKIVKKDEQLKIAEERTEVPVDAAWKRVEKAINGKFADRFIEVMDNLPDKDFMRIYLKALEFFKPKVVRQEAIGAEDTEVKINVQLMGVNEEGNIVELKLNENTNTYE